MYKVELDINHIGCWGSEINVKFPNHKLSSIDCRWVRDQVAHILLAHGDSSKFKKIIEYLQKRKDVRKVEILSEDEQNIYLRILTKATKKVKHFSDIFFAHHCFPIAPTRFEKTSEIWTLGSANKKNITEAYNILKRTHKLKIKSLKEEKLKEKLTKKQRDILAYAKHFGYYEWPRKKSVTEICQMVNIPKTVFLSHLRKAENKIINEHLSHNE